AMFRDLSPVDYQPPGTHYGDLLQRVQAIFERARSESVPLEARIAAADALGQAGDTRLDLHHSDYWVTIPTGRFLMGAQNHDSGGPNFDAKALEDESPVHEVYLDEYRIAPYPVTVGQYQSFVEDEGYAERRWWSAGGFGAFTEPEEWEQQLPYPARPVVG